MAEVSQHAHSLGSRVAAPLTQEEYGQSAPSPHAKPHDETFATSLNATGGDGE